MQKIKLFLESEKGKDILVVLIVILVGIGSFELGRLSKSDRSGGIKIEYTDPSALESLGGVSETANALRSSVAPAQNKAKGGYFASSRGTKYYPADCSAGQSIKESNKVWFETRDEAERAGYELSSSCR
ncbi:MAG: hypothetical protein UY01_C0016G0013 [Candidatus Nomurabacteria bacterium GW2011_GWB1_47_6]|uniref:Ada DNA repair metal-binding domain-containing protein n=1 Tax=Candidatus Nomurabacteria bacterium GW2011_GWB1_47_6 TaxID=1618749 RepID=A0A0G1VAU9_9BACT|nr:MAG: hypothetical protein UY01_C0016G0013 [Candidatus Nomurabacteria bacterium GW2011_GWB1_47_6]